jgi:hypothetical protein
MNHSYLHPIRAELDLRRTSTQPSLLRLVDGSFTTVDPELFDDLRRRSWRVAGDGYVACGPGTQYLHRIVWLHLRGAIPERHQIHHIDGDSRNNRLSNLVCLSAGEHARLENLRRATSNPAGYRGITAAGTRWLAQIKNHGKLIRLGVFDLPEDAARAYDTAARSHFGSLARLNFPSATYR